MMKLKLLQKLVTLYLRDLHSLYEDTFDVIIHNINPTKSMNMRINKTRRNTITTIVNNLSVLVTPYMLTKFGSSTSSRKPPRRTPCRIEKLDRAFGEAAHENEPRLAVPSCHGEEP